MKKITIFMIISIMIISIITPAIADQMEIGNGDILLARGDTLEFKGPNTDTSDQAWVWIFSFNKEGNIYGQDIPLSHSEFFITNVSTNKLTDGVHMVIVQFSGKNDIQEVFYDNKTSEFSSPWKYVKPVYTSDNPITRSTQLIEYCNNSKEYCDDKFFIFNITIEPSFIKFTDMYQYSASDIYQDVNKKDITKNGQLYVGGLTNLNANNKITVLLDYVQSVTATTTSNPAGYNTWGAFLNITALRSGSHIIDIRSNKTDNLVTNLDIGQYIPTPKPTPTQIRYVSNEFISTTQKSVQVGKTPTPKVVTTPNNFVPVITTIPDHTPPPIMPNAIKIAPTSTNKISSSATSKISLDIFVVIFGIIGAIFIIRKP